MLMRKRFGHQLFIESQRKHNTQDILSTDPLLPFGMLAAMEALQRQESFPMISFWISQLCDFGC